MQKKSFVPLPQTSLECLLVNLQQKIRVMFPSVSEAYRFFDMKGNQKCSKESFVFNSIFLHLEFSFHELLELYGILDTKQDGTLDESEFQGIF
jgi:hypothetical protein